MAKCERGFSAQNRIKINCIETKSLGILMKLSEEGPRNGFQPHAQPNCGMKQMNVHYLLLKRNDRS